MRAVHDVEGVSEVVAHDIGICGGGEQAEIAVGSDHCEAAVLEAVVAPHDVARIDDDVAVDDIGGRTCGSHDLEERAEIADNTPQVAHGAGVIGEGEDQHAGSGEQVLDGDIRAVRAPQSFRVRGVLTGRAALAGRWPWLVDRGLWR
jgi:hypothetical protein